MITGYFGSLDAEQASLTSSDSAGQVRFDVERAKASLGRVDSVRTYSGKRVSYRFRLGEEWAEQPIPATAINTEYFLDHNGFAKLEVMALGKSPISDLYAEEFPESIRSSIEQNLRASVPLAKAEMIDHGWVEVNDVQWRSISLKQQYPTASELRYVLFTAGPEGSVVIHLIVPNDERAIKLRDEVLGAFEAPASDIDRISDLTTNASLQTFRSTKSGLTARLSQAWSPMDVSSVKDEMREASDALGELVSNTDLAFRLGQGPVYGATLETEVVPVGPDELDPVAFQEQDCKDVLQVRRTAMESAFPGFEVSMSLRQFRTVSMAGAKWLEIRYVQSLKRDPIHDRNLVIQRLTQRGDTLVAITCGIKMQHPEIERLATEAVGSFSFSAQD